MSKPKTEPMIDGGWRFRDDGRGWELDPSQAARVRREVGKALKRIAKRQALTCPACHLCGQRCIRLDRAGLCSKNTAAHMQARREHDARMRARRG